MARRLYSLLLYLLLPFAIAGFLWRGWRSAACRGSLSERLGLRLSARPDRPLWLHAASVGELRALAALLHVMTEDSPLLVTVGTPTGLARARELFASEPRVSVQAAPWDLPGAVRRFLAATRPRAGVIIETELWPNLIACAHSRGVPMVLVSARLSPRSLRRYLRWAPGLMRATVRAFAAIGAQGEADRARLLQLGADAAKVRITGNLKFGALRGAGDARRGAALRAHCAASRPLWVAGSTHPGEEDVVLAAQQQLLARYRARGSTAPLLALAPRRPERFAQVDRWLAAAGLRHARSTALPPPQESQAIEVVLVDQMGVLGDWYAAADAAFVGGSLVPVGGHNLLEPAVLGRPVLTGPHTFNAPEVAQSLLEAGGACMVRDAGELSAALAAWLGDSGLARHAGDHAAAAVAAHRGAAARSVALLTVPALQPAAVTGSAPSASG